MPTQVSGFPDVAPASWSAATWTDIDVTSHVGSDAGNIALVHLRVVNSNAAAQNVGIRPNGSTDEEYTDINATNYADFSCAVDSNDVFEFKFESDSTGNTLQIHLYGYSTTAEAEGLVNGYNFDSVLTLNTYTDVDLSSQFTGTAHVAFGLVTDTAFSGTDESLRPDGSTDDFVVENAVDGPTSNSGDAWKAFCVPCVSEIFEMYSGDPTDRDHFVYGVITNGDIVNAVANCKTNGRGDTHDDDPGGTLNNTWVEDIDISSYITAGDTWLMYTLWANGGVNIRQSLRPSGTEYDELQSANSVYRTQWGFQPNVGSAVDFHIHDTGTSTGPRGNIVFYGSVGNTPVVAASGGNNFASAKTLGREINHPIRANAIIGAGRGRL